RGRGAGDPLPRLVVGERAFPVAAVLAHLPQKKQRLAVIRVARHQPLEDFDGLRVHSRAAEVEAELEGERPPPFRAEARAAQEGLVDANGPAPVTPTAEMRAERHARGD